MKNKGFSLIEVVVAVAIIVSLSGIVGLNLRRYMANAKDAKAIASLYSIRSAIQLYQLENSTSLISDTSTAYSKSDVIEALKKLEGYLDNNAKALIKNPEFSIGGSKKSQADGGQDKIVYGGQVRLTFIDPTTSKADGYSIWLEPMGSTGEFDIKGNKWIEY